MQFVIREFLFEDADDVVYNRTVVPQSVGQQLDVPPQLRYSNARNRLFDFCCSFTCVCIRLDIQGVRANEHFGGS